MIKSLTIKNYALIDELEVHFEEGLNILTGQTGAGKSIILGAMNLILGERADTTVIREGANKAVAEGIIATGKNEAIHHILKKNDVEIRDELILRREIRTSGSRAFINDTPVTISVLKKWGSFWLICTGSTITSYCLEKKITGVFWMDLVKLLHYWEVTSRITGK